MAVQCKQYQSRGYRSIYYKRSYSTHPAAPVMMAFLPFKRSPRFVLAMKGKRGWNQSEVGLLDIAVGGK